MDEDCSIMLIKQLGYINESLDDIAKALDRLQVTISDLTPKRGKVAKTENPSRETRRTAPGWQ